MALSIDSTGWLRNTVQQPSPNFDKRPQGAEISLLVIHNISLPPGEFGGPYINDFFTNQLDCGVHPFFQEIADVKVSAHFLIDRKGCITQFVSLYDRAWHAGESCFQAIENCNDFSVGIELEGTDEQPYSDMQYDTLSALTIALMSQCPLMTKDRIVGHSDIAPGRKTDPGPAFEWERFKQSLRT